MAYVNVLEWRAEQVAEWLQGLDDAMYPYAHFFTNNNVTGKGLLNLTVDDLYKLNVEKLGHQEIILEALDSLKNLHYNLDSENLQYVCLRLSCKTRSLCNELRMYGPPPTESVTTSTMAAVADVLDSLCVLSSWLDRAPFKQHQHFRDFRKIMNKISLFMATSAIRDRFAENPINVIRDCCERLADHCDTLIRDCSDCLILQPAHLDIASTRRKADSDDFGIVFQSASMAGEKGAGHLVGEIRHGSPAHQSGRIEAGDEVVQVNYQTVVGWRTKKMLQLIEENPSELILTLKKRPRHSPGLYGQIYMKQFRIPARQKKPLNYINNLPSPRTELLVAPDISFVRSNKVSKKVEPEPISDDSVAGDVASGSDSDDLLLNECELDDIGDADDELFLASTSSIGGGSGGGGTTRDSLNAGDLSRSKSPSQSIRSALSRPRSSLQRRATISGTSSPSHFRAYINISEIWGKNRPPPGSNSSTLHSKDSGLSTMSSGRNEDSVSNASDVLRPKPGVGIGAQESSSGSQRSPRPITVATFDLPSPPSSDPHCVVSPSPLPSGHEQASVYMNLPENSKAKATSGPSSSSLQSNSAAQTQYVNLSLESPMDGSQYQNPRPKPRSHLASSSPTSLPMTTNSMPTTSTPIDPTPSKKRPIPQPRRRTPTSSASHKTFSTSGSDSAGDSTPTSTQTQTQTPSGKAADSLSKSLRQLLPEAASLALKSPQHNVPVPTNKFKSYKRVVAASPSPPAQGSAQTGTSSGVDSDPLDSPSRKPLQQQQQPPAAVAGAGVGAPSNSSSSPPVIPFRHASTVLSSTPAQSLGHARPTRNTTVTPTYVDDIPLPTSAPPPRPSKPGSVSPTTAPLVPGQRQASSASSSSSSNAQRRLSGSGCLESRSSTERLSGSESRRSSTVSASDKGTVPYYMSDVYRGETPEKNWIDSLRRQGEEGGEIGSGHAPPPLPPSAMLDIATSGFASPSDPPPATPPKLPQRNLQKSSSTATATTPNPSKLRSAHCYQPMSQFGVVSQSHDEMGKKSKGPQLKYVFDMDLQQQRGSSPRSMGMTGGQETEKLCIGRSSESSFAGGIAPSLQPTACATSEQNQNHSEQQQQQQQQQQQPTLPPLFQPSSYSFQDMSYKKSNN